MNIVIRNVDDLVAMRLNQMAKDQKISREEFLRRRLNVIAAAKDVANIQNRSDRILEAVTDVVERNNTICQQSNTLLQRVSEILGTYTVDDIGKFK